MAAVEDVISLGADLDESLYEITDCKERKQLIRKHLEKADSLAFLVPDFEQGLDWLNVSEPLSLTNQLAGKLVVLDFFTYCCINCMHVLPDIEHLETKFKITDGVVAVGVHSAKFLNEKVTANILSAVLRYEIDHPVVNDANATVWHQLQVSCWPTFVIVGPERQYLYAMVGEGNRDRLMEFVETALEHYNEKGLLKSSNIPVSLERNKHKESLVKFPGKVCLLQSGCLAIADTGNHRILLVDAVSGVVQNVIGGKQKGYKDGDFTAALFSSPQGVVVWRSSVFVADTNNHVIRQIDLESRQVKTIAGTGRQGNDHDGGKSGPEQDIASPWALHLGWTESGYSEGKPPSILYIAMAGTHQLWGYFFSNTKWYKGSEYKAGVFVRLAGSGNEENRNNSYPAKASFAQPSGLALSHSKNKMFIADAESSTVRSWSIKDGAVKGLVGGERDPKNLFAFGDVDGAGVAAKLQHPLGVALLSDDGPLLVADSYNHKIKVVDIKTGDCKTLIGFSDQGRQLDEPGGLCIDQQKKVVYIADTNQHAIKVYNMETKELKELPLIMSESSPPDTVRQPAAVPKPDTVLPLVEVQSRGCLDLQLSLSFKEGNYLNHEAPNAWKLFSEDDLGAQILSESGASSGKLKALNSQVFKTLQMSGSIEGQSHLVISFQLFVCSSDSLCTVKKRVVAVPVKVTTSGPKAGHAQIDIPL